MRYVPFILVLAACGGGTATAAETRTIVIERVVMEAGLPAGVQSGFAVGDEVLVEYGGTWYPARVQAVLPDGRVEIAYDGYNQDWNEAVGPTRIRPRGALAAPGTPVPSAAQLAKGAAVFVEWRGQWYPGRVRAVTPDQRVEVAYDGYDDQWNETVGLARLRVAD